MSSHHVDRFPSRYRPNMVTNAKIMMSHMNR